jgi:uncharacterized protein
MPEPDAPEAFPFAEARFPGTAPIDAYGNGGFRFAGMSHKGSILCLPDAVTAWPPASFEEIDEASFRPVTRAEKRPELLLLGTGKSLRPLPERLKLGLFGHSVRVEVMATGAAARTYNVLLAEGRSVGAALIAVD